MTRWLKRALYLLFWRFPPDRCDWCGAEVEMDAPLRASRGQIWADHGRWHAGQRLAAIG